MSMPDCVSKAIAELGKKGNVIVRQMVHRPEVYVLTETTNDLVYLIDSTETPAVLHPTCKAK